MEGCPENNNLLYLVLSALLFPFLFVVGKWMLSMYRKSHKEKSMSSKRELMKSVHYAELQLELFGEKALKNLQHLASEHNLQKMASTISESKRFNLLKEEGGDSIKEVDTASDNGDDFNDFMKYMNEDKV